jgi:hypothetical protein
MLRVPLTLRPSIPIFGKTDESIMYKLFVRVCYTGPRIGYPHEPGYDWVCPHCKFRFPENPRIGSQETVSGKGEKEAQAEKEALNMAEKQSLERAGIKVTRDTFETLLDEVHKRYTVEKIEKRRVALTGIALLEQLATIDPPPFEKYKETLIPLIEGLRTLQDKKPSLREYSDVYADLSDFVNKMEILLTQRLGKANMDIFRKIFDASPQRIAEFLRANYLVIFNQIVTHVKTEPKKKVRATYQLGPKPLKDIQTFMNAHFQIVDTFSDRIFLDSFPEAKLKEAIERLRAMLPWFSYAIRPNVIPGAKIGLPFLLRYMLYGIFIDLMNPNHIPKKFSFATQPTKTVLETDSKKLLELVYSIIAKTAMEDIQFTDEEIRLRCRAREELEKANRIEKIDRKSKSLKDLDKIQKSIGLGDYSIKENSIFSYEEEQYAKDQLEMEQMGVNRFQYLYRDGNIVVPQNVYSAEKGAGYDNNNKEDLDDN